MFSPPPFEQLLPWNPRKVCLSVSYPPPSPLSPPSPPPATPPPPYQSLSDGNAESRCTPPEEDDRATMRNLHPLLQDLHLCIGPMGGKEGPKQWFLLNEVLRQLLHKLINFHFGAASCLLHQVAVNSIFCHIFCPDTLFTLLLVARCCWVSLFLTRYQNYSNLKAKNLLGLLIDEWLDKHNAD